MAKNPGPQLPNDFSEFLLEARGHGYATEAGESSQLLLPNGSNQISYDRAPYSYTDTWVGGIPYSGMETIARSTEEVYHPLWAMIYRETFRDEVLLPEEELVEVLEVVLDKPNLDLPLRGPKRWEEDGLVYWTRPVVSGSKLENFDVEELINKNGQRVYAARFMGGLVNQNHVLR